MAKKYQTEMRRVVLVAGIKEKEVVPVEDGFFKLRDGIKDEYASYLVDIGGVLWFAHSKLGAAKEVRDVFTVEKLRESWELAKSGKAHGPINRGLAEFFGELELGEQLEEQRKARIEQERQARLDEKARQEAEAARMHQEELDTAEKILLAEGRVRADLFVELCKRHRIDIPLRTHGWINKSLVDIGSSGLSFYGRQAQGIWAVLRNLLIELRKKHEAICSDEQYESPEEEKMVASLFKRGGTYTGG